MYFRLPGMSEQVEIQQKKETQRIILFVIQTYVLPTQPPIIARSRKLLWKRIFSDQFLWTRIRWANMRSYTYETICRTWLEAK